MEEFTMSKFNEIRESLKKSVDEAGGRKTFSETAFNQLGTAMLNIVSFDDDVNSEVAEAAIGLRDAIITDVMRKSGHEADEIEKAKSEHVFSTMPLYDYVGNLIEEYLDTGKALRLPKRENLNATLKMETIEECTKEYPIPSKPGESVKYLEKEHKRIKVSSTTPDNLKEEIK